MQIFVVMNPEKVLGRLHSRSARMDDAISRWHGLAGEAVRHEAERLAPSRTGRLRRSIFATVHGQTIRVGSRLSYAAFVNNGTRAHTIKPVRGSVLRFRIGGRVIFARQVRHPGTRPTRFLQRALENKRNHVVALLKQYTLQESRLLD